MKQTGKGLLVAAVPATLGVLFGLGIIFYSIQHKTTEEASADGAKQAASDVQSFVKTTCGACHGADLKGGVAPSLVKAGQTLDEKTLEDILKNGKGTMPKGLATGKEAEVAQYLKTLK